MNFCNCSSGSIAQMIRHEASGTLTPSTRSLRTPPPHQGRDTPLPASQQPGTLLGLASVSSSARTATPNPPHTRSEAGMLQLNAFAYQVAQYPQVMSVPTIRPPNGVAVSGMGVTLPRTPPAPAPRSVTPRPLRPNAAQTVEPVTSQVVLGSTMPDSPKQQPLEHRQADAELRRGALQEGQDFYGWFAKASESVLQSADALGQDVARLAHLVDTCESHLAKLRDDFGGQQKQIDELAQGRRVVEDARSQELAEREAILAKLGSVGREAEMMRLEHQKTLDAAVLTITAQREDQREEQRRAFDSALADIAAQREEWRAANARDLEAVAGMQQRLSQDQERLQGMSSNVVESLGSMRDELLAIRTEQEDAIRSQASTMAEALRKEQQEAMQSKAEAMQAAVRQDIETLQAQLGASQLNARQGQAAASPEQLEALEQAVCEELQLIKKESHVLANQLRQLSEDQAKQARSEEAVENVPRAEEKLEGQHLDLATSKKFEELGVQLNMLTRGVEEIRTLFAASNLEEHATLLNAESEARLALKESLDAQCISHTLICDELRIDLKAAVERLCLLESNTDAMLGSSTAVRQDTSTEIAMLEHLLDRLTGSDFAPEKGSAPIAVSAIQADALARLRIAFQNILAQQAECAKQEIAAQIATLCQDVDELRGHVQEVSESCKVHEKTSDQCECNSLTSAQGGVRRDLVAGSSQPEASDELQSMVHLQHKFNEFSAVVWERLLDLGSTQDALIRQTSEIARLDKDVEIALGKLKQLDAGCGAPQLESELAELRADLGVLKDSMRSSQEARGAAAEGQGVADEMRGFCKKLEKLSSDFDSMREKLQGSGEAVTSQCRKSLALEISQAEGTTEPKSLRSDALEEHPELQKAIKVLHNSFDPLAQELSEFSTIVLGRLTRLETTQDAHAILLQTREAPQRDAHLQALHGRLEQLESVHKEQIATSQLCDRLSSVESTLREASSQAAQLSQDVDSLREDGSAASKQLHALRKEESSLVERLTRLEFTVAEGAASLQQEQHLQIVRALHVDVQTILKRLSRLEQLSSELGADHSQTLQATTDLRMQVERAMERIARVESLTGEHMTGFNQSLVSFGSAPTSPTQASRSPERGEVKLPFAQLRSELDTVLGRLAYAEATAEEDRAWRERTTYGIGRMEQSLGEHGDAIRAVSEAFEALCSMKAMGPNPETSQMPNPSDAVT